MRGLMEKIKAVFEVKDPGKIKHYEAGNTIAPIPVQEPSRVEKEINKTKELVGNEDAVYLMLVGINKLLEQGETAYKVNNMLKIQLQLLKIDMGKYKWE